MSSFEKSKQTIEQILDDTIDSAALLNAELGCHPDANNEQLMLKLKEQMQRFIETQAQLQQNLEETNSLEQEADFEQQKWMEEFEDACWVS